MSEVKKRTIADIQAEYQGSCTRAGHLQYQVFTLQKDLDLLNDKLRELNLEAAAVQRAEDEAKAAAEAPKGA